VALTLFFILLVGLPLLVSMVPSHSLQVFEAFYRAGSLVFGGGHVVLPLLQASVVPPGWVTNDAFLAGYGAAQAVPGPLFTFAAYLGAVMSPEPNGWKGASLCLVAVFLPSFLLVIGALPFWNELRQRTWAQSALRGVNAAVVGLLLAALPPSMDCGYWQREGFCLGELGFPSPVHVEGVPVARRSVLCFRRSNHWSSLMLTPQPALRFGSALGTGTLGARHIC
jgi:chromate transporter